MNGRTLVTTLALALAVAGMPPAGEAGPARPAPAKPAPAKIEPAAAKRGIEKITKSDEAWRKQLTPEQYKVLRREGTEMAFTGRYWNHHGTGVYLCAGCGLELFSSETKFDSGTGWPSYWAPIAKDHVREVVDRTLGMERVEVECARCGGHLGHVFDDGPKPTGLRYCMNSASLEFKAKK
jgi:peptide-methionine (R)-S-oxide reductase